MPLDAELLELLACPSEDHASLHEETHDGTEEAVPGPNGLGKDASSAATSDND